MSQLIEEPEQNQETHRTRGVGGGLCFWRIILSSYWGSWVSNFLLHTGRSCRVLRDLQSCAIWAVHLPLGWHVDPSKVIWGISVERGDTPVPGRNTDEQPESRSQRWERPTPWHLPKTQEDPLAVWCLQLSLFFSQGIPSWQSPLVSEWTFFFRVMAS